MKCFSTLTNVLTAARYRWYTYLSTGFDNEGEFSGMQYRDERGGDRVYALTVL